MKQGTSWESKNAEEKTFFPLPQYVGMTGFSMKYTDRSCTLKPDLIWEKNMTNENSDIETKENCKS